MEWLRTLDAGPLVTAAARFLEAHPGAPARPFPRGVEGLRAFCDAVETWADEEPSALDEGFVEGAGALLACLLLDHVGRGAHLSRDGAHRVRLGADGFFDPFAAIEAALEAEDPRAAIVEAVRDAEAEAHGHTGVGRAMRILRITLARERPDLGIASAFGASVTLRDGVELDLTRVLRATDGEPEGAAVQAIAKLVAMLPGGASAATTFGDVRASSLPRVAALASRPPSRTGAPSPTPC
ncbi:MAG: hypothetical protein R3B82_01485 [Sandaracinaceae bacterium]